MEFGVTNEVIYDFDGRVSVAEVAKSLLAQDRLLREAIGVVQLLYPGLEIQKIDIAIQQVSHESPYRSQMLAFLAGVFSGEIGSDMPDLIQTISGGRLDAHDNWDALLSLIILAILVIMADKIRAKYWPDASEQILAAQKERFLEAASNGAQVPRGTMKEAIEGTIAKRPGIIGRASMDMLGPAKRHHARSLRVGPDFISKEAIAALPSDAQMLMYQQPTETDELERVRLKFYAHDRENPKKWAAAVEEVSPQRLKLHLAPHIKPEGLFTRGEVMADVVMTSMRDDEGDYHPTLYILTRVYDDDAKTSPRAG